MGVIPYDGGSYDSVIPVPGSDTLLVTYAVSTSPFDIKIMGALLSVRRRTRAGSSYSGLATDQCFNLFYSSCGATRSVAYAIAATTVTIEEKRCFQFLPSRLNPTTWQWKREVGN